SGPSLPGTSSTLDQVLHGLPQLPQIALGHQRSQLLVRLLLLAAELLDERGDATPVGRRHLVVEVMECGDRHVPIPPFSEGIRQALDGIQRLAMLLCREARLEDLEGGTEASGG